MFKWLQVRAGLVDKFSSLTEALRLLLNEDHWTLMILTSVRCQSLRFCALNCSLCFSMKSGRKSVSFVSTSQDLPCLLILISALYGYTLKEKKLSTKVNHMYHKIMYENINIKMKNFTRKASIFMLLQYIPLHVYPIVHSWNLVKVLYLNIHRLVFIQIYNYLWIKGGPWQNLITVIYALKVKGQAIFIFAWVYGITNTWIW